MGNYIFTTGPLVDAAARAIRRDESRATTSAATSCRRWSASGRRVYAYDFSKNEIPGMLERERGYWRDVGTIDAYWQANMDLVAVEPVFDLYNMRWPIRTYTPPLPPAKFVFAEQASASASPPTRWSPRAASSPAGASTAACCRPACASTASPTSRSRS